MKHPDICICGAGVFGLTAALELNDRGYSVLLVDPGPIPHPDAASTDISKIVRMEYGADALYTEMAELAMEGWRQWNLEWSQNLFHETGVAMLTRNPMQAGGYEYESYTCIRGRGHDPTRLRSDEITERFPAWTPGYFVDGFYHDQGGFAESGRVVAKLAEVAHNRKIAIRQGSRAREILKDSDRVTGIRFEDGSVQSVGKVLVAAGAATQFLVPELQAVMKTTGHPVFHIRTNKAASFFTPEFTVFTADVSQSGWYGFPMHPSEHVVKIANHGVGQMLHPYRDRRVVDKADFDALKTFLQAGLPRLLDQEIVYTRRCLYSDTLDEHFWIDNHPVTEGLSVAAGGSGHGFKFAPILGKLIADILEQKPNLWKQRFLWRELTAETRGQEAARYHG